MPRRRNRSGWLATRSVRYGIPCARWPRAHATAAPGPIQRRTALHEFFTRPAASFTPPSRRCGEACTWKEVLARPAEGCHPRRRATREGAPHTTFLRARLRGRQLPPAVGPQAFLGSVRRRRCHAPIGACTLLADAGLDHGMRSCRLGVVARARRGRPRCHRHRQARGGVRPLSPRRARPTDRRTGVRSRRAGGGGHPRGRRVHRRLQRRQLQHRVGARGARALPRAQGHRAHLRSAPRRDLRAPEHPDGRDHDVGRQADPADAPAHRQGGAREPRRRASSFGCASRSRPTWWASR